MRLPRSEVIDPGQVQIAHVYNRTVRRCFLMGHDDISGKNFDHRKVWIERSLQEFAAAFGIDLLSYAILSNHFHLILRSRPDVVAGWDDEEVARRWLMLCPNRRDSGGKACKPTEKELRSIHGCPLHLADIRQRLSSLSWWMRLLCQRVATRANREDEQSGRFFQDRYRATLLVDEASLLACSAYVDLNLIRAAMCEKLEDSKHTAIEKRLRRMQSDHSSSNAKPSVTPERLSADDFLSPLSIDETSDAIGLCESKSASRCSDKGYLSIPLIDYVDLLDWTARQGVSGKHGKTPKDAPPILKRLGLANEDWIELTEDFGKLFSSVAGQVEHVDSMRSHRTHRRFRLRRRARELMTA